MTQLDIVGLCGSLRAQSLNRMALKLAGNCMPAGMQLDVAEWRELPVFDADVFDKGFPAAVQTLRERIRRADAVLVCTPEYNFSIPGGLKNTIDWVSRGDDQPFNYKPVAVLSASPGPLGGARVQYDLRRVMQFMNAQVLPKPEIFIGGASGKFNDAGDCTDDTTRKFVTQQMSAFEKWIRGVKALAAAVK